MPQPKLPRIARAVVVRRLPRLTMMSSLENLSTLLVATTCTEPLLVRLGATRGAVTNAAFWATAEAMLVAKAKLDSWNGNGQNLVLFWGAINKAAHCF
jgi:hypothetical protein